MAFLFNTIYFSSLGEQCHLSGHILFPHGVRESLVVEFSTFDASTALRLP